MKKLKKIVLKENKVTAPNLEFPIGRIAIGTNKSTFIGHLPRVVA